MEIESKDFTNESEIRTKYQKPEESTKRFSWKIQHLKESYNNIDDLVRESFNDIIDEIILKIENIVLALHEKHLWNVEDKYKRDGWKIKRFQDN